MTGSRTAVMQQAYIQGRRHALKSAIWPLARESRGHGL